MTRLLYYIKFSSLNPLAPRKRCHIHITCFGAQGDKVSQLVSQKTEKQMWLERGQPKRLTA